MSERDAAYGAAGPDPHRRGGRRAVRRRRTGTAASNRCSTRWSTTCRAPGRRRRRAAAGRAGVQGAHRARPAGSPPPGVRRHDHARGPSCGTRAPGAPSGSARILRVQADRHTEVDRAVAGDIVAVVGPKAARAGTTLCAPGAPVLLEPPRTAEPVVSVAVEARDRADAAAAADRAGRGWPRRTRRWPCGPTRRPGRRCCPASASCTWRWPWRSCARPAASTVAVGPAAGRLPRDASCAASPACCTGTSSRTAAPGQFAARRARRGAAADGDGFAFASTVIGGRVPTEYVRAVEAGCRDALADGPLGGHPVVGRAGHAAPTAPRTRRTRRSWRSARPAGSALRDALRACEMALLEPVVEVTVDGAGGRGGRGAR